MIQSKWFQYTAAVIAGVVFLNWMGIPLSALLIALAALVFVGVPMGLVTKDCVDAYREERAAHRDD